MTTTIPCKRCGTVHETSNTCASCGCVHNERWRPRHPFKTRVRVEIKATEGGGCVLCLLPNEPEDPENSAEAFAAAVAICESVKGDPNAIAACERHREMIDSHRAMHATVLGR